MSNLWFDPSKLFAVTEGRKSNDAEIKQWETKFHVKFPEELKTIYTECLDGGAFAFPGWTGDCEARYLPSFNKKSEFTFDDMFHLQKEWSIPKHFVPICGDHRACIVLDYRKVKVGENNPCVSVMDSEKGDGWLVKILYPSMKEYIDRVLTFEQNNGSTMPVDFDGYEDVVDVAAGDEDDYNPHVDRGYTEEMV
eukprot:TRINITY_DN11834_c0_g1_i1.p1 TRINITY_DN11834_c0_g1~~TRINITY_DN11834_c0_g1_i1.p1  ORF type:complete len:194 (+),score=49.30 TRINITY_DN11834_c0_g1_i1:82-663(+)